MVTKMEVKAYIGAVKKVLWHVPNRQKVAKNYVKKSRSTWSKIRMLQWLMFISYLAHRRLYGQP